MSANDNKRSSDTLAGLLVTIISMIIIFAIWVLAVDHTTKGLDLLDAIIENKLAGGSR